MFMITIEKRRDDSNEKNPHRPKEKPERDEDLSIRNKQSRYINQHRDNRSLGLLEDVGIPPFPEKPTREDK